MSAFQLSRFVRASSRTRRAYALRSATSRQCCPLFQTLPRHARVLASLLRGAPRFPLQRSKGGHPGSRISQASRPIGPAEHACFYVPCIHIGTGTFTFMCKYPSVFKGAPRRTGTGSSPGREASMPHYRRAVVRVCRWVWMVVRFESVCSVCPCGARVGVRPCVSRV